MDSSPLITDVVWEILSRLPLECLLRLRTDCKFWRDLIDCPAFRKSHTANYKNDGQDHASILLFKSFPDPLKRWESSMIFRDTGISFDLPALGKFLNGVSEFKVVGPVSGLICIHGSKPNADIAVCNPFLDELKILPLHPVCSYAHRIHVRISYDDIACDYKVVRLVSCHKAPCSLHASIYSRNTNSWRELAIGGEYLRIVEPIQSSCSYGEVAYWRANRLGKDVILSLDMKTEVFRSLEMPDYGRNVKIYEKGGKFVLTMLDSSNKWLHVHEGVEGNNGVVWLYLRRVRVFGVFDNFLWRSACVASHESYVPSLKKLILYDYCAEKIVERMEMPSGCHDFSVLEYDGSFVSP